MAIYFESLQQFQASGGLKSSTITAKQLLPAVVAHMQRMDRKFTLHVNGRLPKSMDALLKEVFELSHLQQPFYTQHCASRSTRYINVSKNRVKIDFTMTYRMSRDEESWVVDEIKRLLQQITTPTMSEVEKVGAVHDYIVRAHDYEMETDGSPFTVYTFMHEKQGVCMAYALLFEKMMEQLAIPCYYVVGHADGEGDMGHAWNMVQLDGEWYHVDVTWNDIGKRTNHEIRYRYFLRSDDFMKGDHQWNLEHYPPCVSERYQKLSHLYDVAIFNGLLYFPHPKTAQLTTLDVSKLVFKKELDMCVQFCTMYKDELYFSNLSDRGYLYTYNLQTKALSVVCPQKVKTIQSNAEQLIVTFEEGDPFIIFTSEMTEQPQVVEQVKAAFTVLFLNFGDSWFGSYEGEEQCIAFVSEDGVRLTMQETVKQLTVDVLLHKGLQVNMTSARKDVQLQKPAILTVPKALLPASAQLAFASGMPIDYVEADDVVKIRLNRSEKIIWK